MSFTKMLSHSILLLACYHAASATPIVAERSMVDYPEVVPGPGLPSLASLNITSAELYEIASQHSDTASAMGNVPTTCGGELYAPYSHVDACREYLDKLGRQDCVVPDKGRQVLCIAGEAQVYAESLSGRDETAWCSNVAFGVSLIMFDCKNAEKVAGYTSALWNNNVLVRVFG
ncbi:hypothetical protein CC86DRAFT_405483 [Ophiobolus disseminans]|uniref:Ecp2 effector protein domain-containing protein n=1 Tax=Ophiobolus disseminans TaxID=1469910 RepID=A0A6A7A3M1_9PLEO|nr:hypothetical protein CC86DRAFT_405483 [Ophiobolus disseminans]